MDNSLNIRLKNFVESQNIPHEELQTLLGYKGLNSITHLLYGRDDESVPGGRRYTKVNARMVSLLCSKYNFSTDWLLYGIGEMYAPASTDKRPARTGGMPLVTDHRAYAGVLAGYADNDGGKYPQLHIPGLGNGGHWAALRVYGNSMEPGIHDGDTVIGCQLERGDPIKSNAVYIVVTEREGMALKRLIDLGERLLLISDNPTYEPRQLDKEEAKALFEVKAHIRYKL